LRFEIGFGLRSDPRRAHGPLQGLCAAVLEPNNVSAAR
jgi:hypothetical protein